MASDVLNALSCDLEDYFQVQDCEGLIAREEWAGMPSRLEASTERVLGLLAEAGVKATFFVLGWNAERHPELVRRIAAEGHEVASHGYDHRLAFEQSPEEFRADVCRAKALLEDITGRAVVGYRAPTFSITQRSRWAVGILAEAGYRYDSSIFPVRHDRYGIPSAPRFLHELEGSNGRALIEFPPTTVRCLGCNVPVAGGGYLRLLPARFVLAALRRVNRLGHPAIVYFHPWELDAEAPRLPLRGLSRFRHYVGIRRAADKLRLLLRGLRFTTAAAVVEQWAALQTRNAKRETRNSPLEPGGTAGG